MDELLQNLSPHSPQNGPPVPQFLPKWPWIHNPGNPVADPIVYDTALDAEIEEMTRKKREEFRAKGYAPGLIEKGLLWARNWSDGLIGSFLYEPLPSELKTRVYKSLYTTALLKSEDWIRAFLYS